MFLNLNLNLNLSLNLKDQGFKGEKKLPCASQQIALHYGSGNIYALRLCPG